MRRPRLNWFLLSSVLATALVSTEAHAQATRTITVEVTVQTSTGLPLEDVPLMLLGPADRPVAKTEGDGRATLTGEVPLSDSSVSVRVHGGGDDRLGSTEQQLALALRMKALEEQYWIEQYTRIMLDELQQMYLVTVTAHPAVRVSGVVADQSGGPLAELVITSDMSEALDVTDGQGTFSLAGVRRGWPNCLFVLCHGWSVVPLRLTAEQTQADVDLGQIVLPDYERTAFFRARLSNSIEWREIQESGLIAGVTLVAADGSIMFTEVAYRSPANPDELRLRTDPLALPPGEYYIAPGSFATGRVQVALLRAREQGMDLTGTGIPKVTLVEGQTVDVDVDLLATYLAIREHIGFE